MVGMVGLLQRKGPLNRSLQTWARRQYRHCRPVSMNPSKTGNFWELIKDVMTTGEEAANGHSANWVIWTQRPDSLAAVASGRICERERLT
jgi:hypothetical protein